MLKNFFLILEIVTILSGTSLVNLVQSYPYYPSCSPKNIDPASTLLETRYGKVEGACYNVSVNYADKPIVTKPVLTWLAIPYAEPPVNENRFKEPIPTPAWTNVRNGKNWSNMCVQIGDPLSDFADKKILKSMKLESIKESEDCLYLNIFVPYDAYVNSVLRDDESKQVPIMFWIHGGAFLGGASSLDYYEPSTFVAMSDVVVVTINYRLGPLGFMYIQGTDAIGNQGFLDQHLALEWVYHNADRFGGNRNKITIQGESSGSFSVGYHLMYRPSWPFFRNAILQSGTPIQRGFRLISTNEATRRALEVADMVGCNRNRPKKELMSCLRKVNTSKLADASLEYFFVNMFGDTKMSGSSSINLFPLVENHKTFNNSAEHTFKFEKNFKNCSILVGFVENEMASLIIFSKLFGSNLAELETHSFLNFSSFESLLRGYFKYYPYYPVVSRTRYLVESILEVYLSEDDAPPIKDQHTKNYFDLFSRIISDYFFRCPSLSLAESYAQFNNVYYYEYIFRISTSPYPKSYNTTHADDLATIFGEPLSIKKQPLLSYNPWSSTIHNYSVNERIFTDRIVQYFANFIKNDVPSALINNTIQKWPNFSDRIDKTKPHYWNKLRNALILNENFTPTTIPQIKYDKGCSLFYY